jgi:flagellar hook-basal body complex protein FliE
VHALARPANAPLPMPLTQRLMQEAQAAQAQAAAPTPGGSFSGLLRDGVLQVNSMQQDANTQINEMLTGGDVNQAEVFTAVQKADMAFRMLVQVRNKLMAAYEEINNIRI